jgi:hypothetical protein
VDEAMARYTGKSKAITTIPNKPTPTGIKIWVAAQRGFFLRWLYHQPGKKGGAFGVSKIQGLNTTQSVVPTLLAQLPKASYHVYLDNLFTSTQLLEYLRSQGFAATGTCRTSSGVHEDIVKLKKTREKGANAMPWGTTVTIPTESENVLHIGFQDSAFALAMSTFWDGKSTVLRVRKRPKETAGNAKISRAPFGNQPTKALDIPELYDAYNHYMGAVDLGDQLQGHNGGLRRIRRGPIQALHQYMLLVVLSNCYLITRYSGYELKNVSLRSQDDFRLQVVNALITMGRDVPDLRKRRISQLSRVTVEVPLHSHELIKMTTAQRRVDCVACKGVRFGDGPPPKRVALGNIARNLGRTTKRKATMYGCKQCEVALCKKTDCFALYHRIA